MDFILWRTRTTPSGRMEAPSFPPFNYKLNTKALSVGFVSFLVFCFSLSLIIKSRILFCVHQVIQSLW